ncbi:snare-complex protein syntaxin-18 N-terminus-domain-containing protein [Xylogone sp. PMI_703]|nr:snare-complex protein syntaxin-18 N-terminus-domain-containing protein [Xylogone sp. PMI_703]
MSDLTPILNELLKKHNAGPTANPALTLQNIDGFLKEAYRINSHISSLNTYLRSIRQSYLSTTPPPRRTQSSLKSHNNNKQWRYLTDQQRDEIDAETKQLLRELNASIRNLADAEQLRQDTESTLRRKKYHKLGFGALGAWAAGSGADGGGRTRSREEEAEMVKSDTIKMHRESVLWYLRRKLQDAGQAQAEMMEKRILREMEKNKSMLARTRRASIPGLRDFEGLGSVPGKMGAIGAAAGGSELSAVEMETRSLYPEEELSEEQIQMFEKENQDMLKHYESTLDQVRTAEKSLIEISELQTQLVNNLAMQSAHIDQLVADSYLMTENVGGGNKQLKKATERKSTAKYVFYVSCGLSLFLVVWDLVI